MKKLVLKNFIFVIAFAFMTIIPTFADPHTSMDKQSYDFASANIRNEINLTNDKIKNYTKYKDEVIDKVEMALTGRLIVSDEKLQKIKELMKTIKKESRKEKTLTEGQSISSLVKNEDYDKALEKLEYILSERKLELNDIEKNIETFRQIDKLLE